jgi:membrane protein DedA with SNARE-associated domain
MKKHRPLRWRIRRADTRSMEYVQPYLDYFSQNPGIATALIFLIAFGEALLIIGLFVPSTAVLIGAGMLVGTGHLGFWHVFLATSVGAILGDQLSYWAGRLFGERLKTMWPLNRYPALVARGETFVRQHGGKSIAIGRFVPGVKAVVPGIVGMFGMGQLYFAVVNVTSAIVLDRRPCLSWHAVGPGSDARRRTERQAGPSCFLSFSFSWQSPAGSSACLSVALLPG